MTNFIAKSSIPAELNYETIQSLRLYRQGLKNYKNNVHLSPNDMFMINKEIERVTVFIANQDVAAIYNMNL